MSYLKQIFCPEHPDATLIEDYRYSNGNIVSNFLNLYFIVLYTI